MAGDLRDFIPEGEDNSAFAKGQFSDFVPAGEPLPEGMTDSGVSFSDDSLESMKMGELDAIAIGLGLEASKPGMKKADFIAVIKAARDGAADTKPEEPADSDEDETEDDETDGDVPPAGEPDGDKVEGLDDEV